MIGSLIANQSIIFFLLSTNRAAEGFTFKPVAVLLVSEVLLCIVTAPLKRCQGTNSLNSSKKLVSNELNQSINHVCESIIELHGSESFANESINDELSLVRTSSSFKPIIATSLLIAASQQLTFFFTLGVDLIAVVVSFELVAALIYACCFFVCSLQFSWRSMALHAIGLTLAFYAVNIAARDIPLIALWVILTAAATAGQAFIVERDLYELPALHSCTALIHGIVLEYHLLSPTPLDVFAGFDWFVAALTAALVLAGLLQSMFLHREGLKKSPFVAVHVVAIVFVLSIFSLGGPINKFLSAAVLLLLLSVSLSDTSNPSEVEAAAIKQSPILMQ